MHPRQDLIWKINETVKEISHINCSEITFARLILLMIDSLILTAFQPV